MEHMLKCVSGHGWEAAFLFLFAGGWKRGRRCLSWEWAGFIRKEEPEESSVIMEGILKPCLYSYYFGFCFFCLDSPYSEHIFVQNLQQEVM